MKYPFEFNELLLTSELLDNMGFSEYWGDSGDSGSRTLNLGAKIGDERLISNKEYPLYYIHEIDEKNDECDGYCGSLNYCPFKITNKDFHSMYFLHEMYEDILSRRTPEELDKFLEITKSTNVNCYNYLMSYLKYKEAESK
jgi:hypothetical protein